MQERGQRDKQEQDSSYHKLRPVHSPKSETCISLPSTTVEFSGGTQICFVAIYATVHQLSFNNMSATVAWQRKSFKLVVGAPRRRAAPRSQSYGAAHFAVCHFIGWRGPLKLDRQSEIHRPSAPVTQIKMALVLLAFGFKSARAVRPNHSLNRTHCGVPPFGLQKPSPNASTPQWAG